MRDERERERERGTKAIDHSSCSSVGWLAKLACSMVVPCASVAPIFARDRSSLARSLGQAGRRRDVLTPGLAFHVAPNCREEREG